MKGVVALLVGQLGEPEGASEVLGEGVAGAATIKVHHIVHLFITLLDPSVLTPSNTGVKGGRSIMKCNLRAMDRQCMEDRRGPLSQQCLQQLGQCNQGDAALHILARHMDQAQALLFKFLPPLQAMGQVLVELLSSLAQWF